MNSFLAGLAVDMHFSSLSATLPRRWRNTATEGASNPTKPPKSSSTLRRRLSSLSTVSSRLSSSGTPFRRPPKGSQATYSSSLGRSSSFSTHTCSGPIYHNNAYSGNWQNNSHSSSQNFLFNVPSTGPTFDFKKPLPPPPKAHPQRRSFMSGVWISKNEGNPPPFRRSSDNNSRNHFLSSTSEPMQSGREWRSQSLVDLYNKFPQNHQNEISISAKPDNYRSLLSSRETQSSGRFCSFGTPQIRRKLSVPTYLSSALSSSNDTIKKSPILFTTSSQDGINRIYKEAKGSCSSLSQPGISTATIFSKNLRSNSWRNLSLIGKVEPVEQPKIDMCELTNYNHKFT